jgi:hypothetical protein
MLLILRIYTDFLSFVVDLIIHDLLSPKFLMITTALALIEVDPDFFSGETDSRK